MAGCDLTFGKAGLAALMLFVLSAVAPLPARAADKLDDLPPGEGRVLVFAYCSACHGLRIVYQQGMSRDRWDDAITFMVQTKGMLPPEPEVRKAIVDYLAEAFPPRRGRTPPNPFLR
jgi:mono/diheme cytochrome c family protein